MADLFIGSRKPYACAPTLTAAGCAGRFFLTCCFAAFLFTALQGCGYEGDKITVRHKRIASSPTVNVAAVWPFSSTYSSFAKGLLMASDEINLSGGVLGKKLKIVLKDDESSVTSGMAIADGCASDPGICAAIGFCDSYVTVPVSPVYSEAGILMVTTSSVDPSFNSFKSPLLFRTGPDAFDIARGIVTLVEKLGYAKTVMCYVNNGYGLCLANACEDELKKRSIPVVDRRPYSSSNALELSRITACWKLLKFDCAILIGEPSGGPQLIRSAREDGIKAPILCGEAMDFPEFAGLEGGCAEGAVVASLFNPQTPGSPLKTRFVSEYRKRFGSLPDAFAAQAYDTTMMLALAIGRAGSASPPDIARALRSLSNEEGVLCRYSFDERGELLGENIMMKTVRDGRFVYIESTAEVSTVKNLIERK